MVRWDERLTTSQAEREMIGLGMSRRRRRSSIDQAASVLILENYLRSVSNTHGNPKGSENVNNQNDRKPEHLEDQEYDDLIVLTDDEGNQEEFRLLLDDLFVGDRQYVVLMPVDGDDDEQEIVILRVDRLNDDEVTLCTISDEDEWEEVIGALYELDLEDDIEVIEDYEDEEEPEA